LAEVNRQLDARGFVIKRGTLVDATLIAANSIKDRNGSPTNSLNSLDCNLMFQPKNCPIRPLLASDVRSRQPASRRDFRGVRK
jgi:hypothetical protein